MRRVRPPARGLSRGLGRYQGTLERVQLSTASNQSDSLHSSIAEGRRRNVLTGELGVEHVCKRCVRI